MGYGDLWEFNLKVLIFYKSRLGFMGQTSEAMSVTPIPPHSV